VARVRARLRNNNDQPSDEILTIGPVSINVAAHTVTRDGQPVQLTPLEFDLFDGTGTQTWASLQPGNPSTTCVGL